MNNPKESKFMGACGFVVKYNSYSQKFEEVCQLF